MDYDYIEKLKRDDPEAATWLSQFNNEMYGNTLNKDWRKNLHMKEDKKAIYDQTNARNRDMYNNRYKYNEDNGNEDCNIETLVNSMVDMSHTSPEDAVIDFMDKDQKINKFVKAALKAKTDREFTQELTKVTFDIE